MNCSKRSCRFPALGLAGQMPQLRAGSVAAFEAQRSWTVSDRIDKTCGWVICTAGSSSTKWGLFWLMNIELLLSNSKLCPVSK